MTYPDWRPPMGPPGGPPPAVWGPAQQPWSAPPPAFTHQGFPSQPGAHGWHQRPPSVPGAWPPPQGGVHLAPGWAGHPGPHGPRKRSGGGVLLGCGIALLVGIAGLVLVFLVPLVLLAGESGTASTQDPTPIPSPSPTPSATPGAQEPTPTPSPPDPVPEPEPEPPPFQLPDRDFGELPAPHSDDPSWVTVQRAALYEGLFPAHVDCPPPIYLTTMAELQAWADPQLDCLQAAWTPVLASLGLPSHTIPHYYYEGSSATSPCGTATAPAFYCAVDGGAIYLGEDLLLGTAHDFIWGKDLLGHEYGHHLQGASGFFPEIYNLPGGNEILRRLEIQATCLSMGSLRRDASFELDQYSYDFLERHLRSFLDDGIHGRPDSLAYWGMRGFHADVAGDCNTWVVGAEWVE